MPEKNEHPIPHPMPGVFEGGPRDGMELVIPAETDSVNVPLWKPFDHKGTFATASYVFDRIEDGKARFKCVTEDLPPEQCVSVQAVHKRVFEDRPVAFRAILDLDAKNEMRAKCAVRGAYPYNVRLAWHGTVAEAYVQGHGDWVGGLSDEHWAYIYVADITYDQAVAEAANNG